MRFVRVFLVCILCLPLVVLVVAPFLPIPAIQQAQPALAQTSPTPRSLTRPPEAKPPQAGGTYRRALVHDPATLDPATLSDIYGRTIAQQIYDGLVQFDEALAIRPAIASSWKSTRDGLVWTFNLRRGVKFHNGREVMADDFVYSFTRILDPKVGSEAAEVFLRVQGAKEFAEGRAPNVRGLQALDRYTFKITLTASSTPFVTALAVGAAKVIPREAVEEMGKEFGQRPVGTGPFRLKVWDRAKEIILEANRDYFGGRPYLDEIVYRIYPPEKRGEILTDFKAGLLEDAPIPVKERRQIIEDKTLQYLRRPILGIRFFAFNTKVKPLDNPLVRQALVHAVDRRWIARDIFGDRYLPGAGVLPPGTYGYDPNLAGQEYNPEKARTLLAKAGFPGGKGLPPLEHWSASALTNEEFVAEEQAVAKFLGVIGVQVELKRNTNWPSYKASFYDGKLPMWRMSWYADTPDPYSFLHLLFHSKGPHNTTKYRNPDVDALLDRAEKELDYFARVRLYQQAERIIVRDAPVIVLGYYTFEHVFQPYVRGIQVSALGERYIPMRHIWLENSRPHTPRK
ncbi:MAG: ABC transporter substrate-binding protein [Acidobacteria bacterium]|nr:ABC transporter substrate-binding protein [Acidobacteriota bacterium]